MSSAGSKTQFEQTLSDETLPDKFIQFNTAESIFNFFKDCPVFRWSDANNDCEDRANAICLLLDAWGIPNYKGWVFSGMFLKKDEGSLVNTWNYHVATLVPVQQNNQIVYYIIDPATADKLQTIENWAANITDQAYSYHVIKSGSFYIFPNGKIQKYNWHKRDKRNNRWTMHGLSGINGISSTGKAQLTFKKSKIKKTTHLFNQLKNSKPEFLQQNIN